jgi:hypothetical protein
MTKDFNADFFKGNHSDLFKKFYNLRWCIAKITADHPVAQVKLDKFYAASDREWQWVDGGEGLKRTGVSWGDDERGYNECDGFTIYEALIPASSWKAGEERMSKRFPATPKTEEIQQLYNAEGERRINNPSESNPAVDYENWEYPEQLPVKVIRQRSFQNMPASSDTVCFGNPDTDIKYEDSDTAVFATMQLAPRHLISEDNLAALLATRDSVEIGPLCSLTERENLVAEVKKLSPENLALLLETMGNDRGS